METPLVTVICLCYNHAGFVRESLESVLHQTHTRIQLIVVDDASSDDSAKVIREFLVDYPDVVFIALKENVGNCRAFNRGLAMASGDFVVDLAADDVLLPSRIEVGLIAFASYGSKYGVHFSDAELIDEAGRHLGFHSERFPGETVPQGDIYREVVTRYFICSPTMMMRKTVLDRLNGYDESLAYEDFDFWVRSSREFLYGYSPEPLVRRRRVVNSMSQNQYRFRSRQLASTFRVCEKIFVLNRSREERQALSKRIRYEFRKAIQFGEFRLAFRYLRLLLR